MNTVIGVRGTRELTPYVSTCPGPRCWATIPSYLTLCRACWSRVPRELRCNANRAIRRWARHPGKDRQTTMQHARLRCLEALWEEAPMNQPRAAVLAAWRGGHQGRPGWWVRLDFDADAIEELKQAIPSRHRTWSAEEEAWWIAEEYEPEMLAIAPGLEAYRHQERLL